MSKLIIYKKLCNVQQALMGEEILSVELEYLLPLIFNACLKEQLMFYFNFIENACVLNLRDIDVENLELNVRLYYPNEPEDISVKKLKEQVLINTFLLTKAENRADDDVDSSSNISTEDAQETAEKPIQESTLVPPTAIRTAMDILEKSGEPLTRKNIENHLQLGKMSQENRRRCIAYLKTMEE